MKASIKLDSVGNVLVSYDDAYTGERITREFFCPADGGYVRESDEKRLYPQVCDKLASRGATLRSPSRAALVDIIRREWRAAQRAEARDRAAEWA